MTRRDWTNNRRRERFVTTRIGGDHDMTGDRGRVGVWDRMLQRTVHSYPGDELAAARAMAVKLNADHACLGHLDIHSGERFSCGGECVKF